MNLAAKALLDREIERTESVAAMNAQQAESYERHAATHRENERLARLAAGDLRRAKDML